MGPGVGFGIGGVGGEGFGVGGVGYGVGGGVGVLPQQSVKPTSQWCEKLSMTEQSPGHAELESLHWPWVPLAHALQAEPPFVAHV